MKAYENYKQSNIDWIGEIPNNWSITKLKFISNIYNGNSLNDDLKEKYESDDLDNIPYISTKDVQPETGKININNGVRIPSNENNFKIAPKGSFVLCIEGGSAGKKIGYLNEDVYFVNKLACFDYENKFLYYYALSENFKNQFFNSLSGLIGGVSISTIRNFFTPFPSLEEQTNIAAFLDYKTHLIDATIEKEKRLIELLKEKRQAVINEAVTKGLNPNTPVKDSGVEWLGEINKDWKIKKIKHTTFVKGRIGWQNLRAEDFLDYGPYYLVTGTDFKNGNINWEGCHRVDEERFNLDPFIILQEDDILITKDGTIGKIAIVKNKPEFVTLNSGVFVTRPIKKDYIPDYLFWVFNSDVFTHFIDYNKSGATIQHLYQNVFLEFSYPLPTFEEQKEIIIYLKEMDSKFQNTISKVEKIIINLQDYRQSLISEAVTGKIDVRDWQVTKN